MEKTPRTLSPCVSPFSVFNHFVPHPTNHRLVRQPQHLALDSAALNASVFLSRVKRTPDTMPLGCLGNALWTTNATYLWGL